MRQPSWSTIAEAHENQNRIYRQHLYLKEVLAAHFEPYDPGDVTLQRIDDLHRPTQFVVTTSLLVDDVAAIDMSEGMFAICTEDEIIESIARRAAKFFLACMNEPVPDNIILGED